ncbi:MAG: hypothetical protein J5J06_13330 [Phycisphaerae bacterium]|nr:hypothetical protein [Phycisphaerae bacterium]
MADIVADTRRYYPWFAALVAGGDFRREVAAKTGGFVPASSKETLLKAYEYSSAEAAGRNSTWKRL